ncbi:hypothetical protein K8I28_14820 [bacterium]|nr:hypothetical protein [bacterium]
MQKLSGIILLVLIFFPLPAHATPSVSVGYLVPNFQIFPIGDLVSWEQIAQGEDINFQGLQDFFYVQINASGGELDSTVYIHVRETLDGNVLLDYWSAPFRLRYWMQGGQGGRYRNSQLARLEDAGWLYSDADRTFITDGQTILGLMDGGNLIESRYTVTFELYWTYEAENGNEVSGLWDSFSTTIQVYNPEPPLPLDPPQNEVIQGLPLQFSWDWTGGATVPRDWILILVEGTNQLNDSPESVMENRSPANTRFNGSPQSSTFHFYTGIAGGEQALRSDRYYYWRVEVVVPTVLPQRPQMLQSDVYSFYYSDLVGDGGGGDAGLGGGFGFDDPDESDDGGLGGGGFGDPGMNPPGGGGLGGGLGGGFDDEPPGGDEPPGDEDDAPPPPDQEEPPGGGGLQPPPIEEDNLPDNPMLRALAQQMNPILFARLMGELEGYEPVDLIINGESGKSFNDLNVLFNQEGFTIVQLELVEE